MSGPAPADCPLGACTNLVQSISYWSYWTDWNQRQPGWVINSELLCRIAKFMHICAEWWVNILLEIWVLSLRGIERMDWVGRPSTWPRGTPPYDTSMHELNYTNESFILQIWRSHVIHHIPVCDSQYYDSTLLMHTRQWRNVYMCKMNCLHAWYDSFIQL